MRGCSYPLKRDGTYRLATVLRAPEVLVVVPLVVLILAGRNTNVSIHLTDGLINPGVFKEIIRISTLSRGYGLGLIHPGVASGGV